MKRNKEGEKHILFVQVSRDAHFCTVGATVRVPVAARCLSCYTDIPQPRFSPLAPLLQDQERSRMEELYVYALLHACLCLCACVLVCVRVCMPVCVDVVAHAL
jgi:hypothetical protein